MGVPGLGFNGEDVDFFKDMHYDELALKADCKIDSGTFTALASYNAYDLVRSQDADFSPLPVLQFSEFEDNEQNSLELRFVSNDSDDFEYVYGVYYQSTDFYGTAITDVYTAPGSIAGNAMNGALAYSHASRSPNTPIGIIVLRSPWNFPRKPHYWSL